MSERPPARPKSWRRQAIGLPSNGEGKQATEDEALPTHSAPGHQGGSFSDAGYHSETSRGQIGFQVWS
jgi:hypothetical protein